MEMIKIKVDIETPKRYLLDEPMGKVEAEICPYCHSRKVEYKNMVLEDLDSWDDCPDRYWEFVCKRCKLRSREWYSMVHTDTVTELSFKECIELALKNCITIFFPFF